MTYIWKKYISIIRLRHILLHTAVLIMLLHSIVPHEHHDELLEQDTVVLYSSNECIFDWLQFVFHDDLGAGHLENFVQGEAPNLVKVSSTIPVVGVILFDSALSESKTPIVTLVNQATNEFTRSLHFRHPDRLRGPPRTA